MMLHYFIFFHQKKHYFALVSKQNDATLLTKDIQIYFKESDVM